MGNGTMTRIELLKEIQEHPERHRHDFDALQDCCFIDGAIDLGVMQAHENVNLGMNGGIRCDVTSGPCACGAWHR